MHRTWQETEAALARGWYEFEGRRVDLWGALDDMRRGVRLYEPGESPRPAFERGAWDTWPDVTQETTLEAVERLGAEGPVAALNFASAREPGGGVPRGAQTQEESLVCSSALYEALARCPEFYAYHREQRDPFHSDRVIHAPDVPVFRRDNGEWLPAPLRVSFLTAAAPNRRIIERDLPGAVERLPGVLAARVRAVLAVAAHHGDSRLVLGAWGCGGCGNSPEQVAEVFVEQLRGDFAGVFEQIVFAVADRHDITRGIFDWVLNRAE